MRQKPGCKRATVLVSSHTSVFVFRWRNGCNSQSQSTDCSEANLEVRHEAKAPSHRQSCWPQIARQGVPMYLRNSLFVHCSNHNTDNKAKTLSEAGWGQGGRKWASIWVLRTHTKSQWEWSVREKATQHRGRFEPTCSPHTHRDLSCS